MPVIVVRLGIVLISAWCLGSCRQTPLERRPFFRVQFQGDSGWIWGASSFRTLDGGRTWSPLETGYTQEPDYVPIEVLRRVDFVDSLVGFQSFRNGLQKSADGGRTWGQISSIRPTALDFVSPETGALWRDKFYLTSDGGGHWLALDDLAVTIWDLCVISYDEFYYTTGSRLVRWTASHGPRLVRDFNHRVPQRVKHVGSDLWLTGGGGLCMKFSPPNGLWTDFSLPMSDVRVTDVVVKEDTLIAVGPKGRLFNRKIEGGEWETIRIGDAEAYLGSVDIAPDGTIFAVGGRAATEFLWASPGSRLALSSEDGRTWKEVRLD